MYDTLSILAERTFIKEILGDLLETSKFQLAMEEVEPIPLLHYDKDSYCEKLYEICWLDEKKGEKIVSMMHQIWTESIYDDFQSRQSDQIFKVEYTEAWCFLSYFFNRQLREWYKDQQLITIAKEEQLQDSKNLLQEKEKELRAEFQIQFERKEREYSKQLSKLVKLEQVVQQNKVISEQLADANKMIEVLQKEIMINKNEKKLIGKKLACVGFKWTVVEMNQLKELYNLKEITCYSAIDDFNKLKTIHVDYIMFFSKLAKHQAFYQLKNKQDVWTVSSNHPKLAFDYILENYLNNIE